MIEELYRKDTSDNPYTITTRNIEVAAGYAVRMASRWKKRIPRWMDPDRFDEAVLAAVMRSSENYDSNNASRATFFTYCHSMVTGALREEDRKQRRSYVPTVSLQGGIPASSHSTFMEERGDYRGNCHPQSPDMYLRSGDDTEKGVVENHSIRYILKSVAPKAGLSEREIDILKMIFILGVKQKDVATKHQVTEGRIHQLKEMGLRKIRTYFVANPEECYVGRTQEE